jgi:DNA-binding CsgD family transcriptional regulator
MSELTNGDVNTLITQAAAVLDRMRQLVEYFPGVSYPQLAQEWFGKARQEVLFANGDPAVCQWHASSCRDAALELVQGRVAVRMLLHPGRLRGCPCGDTARQLHAGGAAVRVSGACRFSALVFDRGTAILWEPTAGSPECLLVRSQTIITPLLEAIEAAWQSGTDLGGFDELRGNHRAAQRRSVLSLLSAGVTDDAGAKRLGISVRTYRRHVADIMTRLGATSRFDAGLRAASLGLTAGVGIVLAPGERQGAGVSRVG